MKNLLKPIALFAMTTVAVIGCTKVSVEQPEVSTDGDLIKLSAGTAVTTKVINQGGRTEAGFENGDNIGVSAFYAAAVDSDAPTLDVAPDTYLNEFSNVKAVADVAAPVAKAEPVVNNFNWIAPNFKFYPKSSQYMFMYAYFPYGDVVTPAKTATTTGVTFVSGGTAEAKALDKLEVVLKSEKIIDFDDTAIITQPDIMVARTATPVNKASIETAARLNFKHMLAQVKFQISTQSVTSKEVKLKKLRFFVPNKGTFNIDLPVVGTVEPAVTANNQFTLTPPAAVTVADPAPAPIYAADEMSILEIDRATNTAEIILSETLQDVFSKPFMTFPFSAEQLKSCKLELDLNFDSSIGDVTKVVDLSDVKLDLKQGQLNTFKLNVSMLEIALTTTVEPWGAAGSDIAIPIE